MVKVQRLMLLAGVLAIVPVSAIAAEPGELGSEVSPGVQTEASYLNLAQGLIQITNVQVESGEAGLRLVLQTSGVLAAPETSTVGNALIAEIPNAALALPEGDVFEVAGPAEGIAFVSITNVGDRVRVSLTGTDAPPTLSVRTEPTGVVLGVLPSLAQGDAAAEEALQISVTGQGDEGYNPSTSSTATGTDTSLRDVPLSIQVIPEAVIDDRGVTELGRVLETAGSVVPTSGRGTSVFGPGFYIRGFNTGGGIFRDGVQATSLSPLSTNDIERVEVLRGPASILFGQGEPGGIINLVPKRPLSEPFYELSATAGSFATYGGALDFSGPLNDDRTVRYRLNVSYENYDSFRDVVNGERLVISPMVTWEIGPNTSLNVYGQYTSDRETIDEGIVVGANGILDLPRDRFLGEEFGEFTQDQFNVGYRLNHQFNDDWSVRHSLQYLQYQPERYAPLFDSFDEATGQLNRLAYYAGGNYQRFFTNAEAVGRFNTGSIQHRLLFGVEYRNVLEQPEFQFSNLYTPINVFNPVYTRIPYAIEPEFFRDDTVNTIGVYVQDQIELSPNLNLLAGIRYDTVDQFRTTQDAGEARSEFEQTDSAFSPRFGIVYQPVEPISLYASYTSSFSPSFGASLNEDGSNFEPERGRQWEVGVKADLSDRLSLNLAAFDIRRQNVTTPDPTNPRFSVQTGEVASRGLELNLGGEISPGWNITAGYTLLDAFVSEDNTDVVGNRLANIPENQFSLWTTYELQAGSLQGLGFGLGLFYVSDRPGNLNNSFTVPSYFRTDAALFYRRDHWRAQLNIENLFDTEYFTVSDESLGVIPGSPLRVTARVAVEF